MSILTLPLERQREIAKRDGFGDDLAAWREYTKNLLAEMRAYSDSLVMVRYSDLTPEEQAAHDRWQRKVDSGNAVR